ncbi:hypothetical protein KKA53_00375 [Candidatus Dependentiae bacterium]|nr:hypothetical protein [Candidatus Dependentiae bacterium]
MSIKIVGFILIAFFFPSCLHKSCSKELASLGGKEIRLCLEMPENKLVFENLSPIVYDALWCHFDRVGFKLVDTLGDCHVLKVTVKKNDSPYKFLSPDLLSYSVKMKIDLLCRLFDRNEKLCAQRLFSFTTLVSKAKDHVMNSGFIDFEYCRLFEREAYRIDQYFRPFLLKSVE